MTRHSPFHPLALSIVALALQAAPPIDAQVWAQGREQIGSPTPEAGSFGAAVALLDFDGDGDLELAVGDPLAQDEDSTHPIVRILVATESGWESHFSYDLDSPNGLGRVLAVGDFDEDGRDDLLIGVPQLNSNGGGVYLVRHTDPSTTILDGIILNGGPSGGACGTSLAVGDFDGDGHLDFATGCPYASFDTFSEVGRVEVGLGGGNGDFDLGFVHQASPDVVSDPETGDEFGFALAAGDFDADGYDDLAVGAPGETVLNTDDGAIQLLVGSPGGLAGTGVVLWQGAAGVPGLSDGGDRFGAVLAAGDFDRGFSAPFCADLAIGVPDDAENAGGAVVVLYGTVDGIVSAGAQIFTVASFAPPSNPESSHHHLGSALATGRIDGGFSDELVVGALGDDEALSMLAGAACVLYGSSSGGLSAEEAICFSGSSREFSATFQGPIDFGRALAIGALDDVSGSELVVGSPGRREVFVLKSALFADGFELSTTNRWSFASGD